MPSWAVAVIVGLASGLLGTLATIGHERGAEFRTRMLAAADDFLQATARCGVWVTDARTAFHTNAADTELTRVIDGLRGERTALITVMLPRLQLLFGEASATWQKATVALSALDNIEGVCRAKRAKTGLRPTLYAMDSQVERWAEAVGTLGAATRADVRRGPVGRGLRHARRWHSPLSVD
jgi:hypothetical protein